VRPEIGADVLLWTRAHQRCQRVCAPRRQAVVPGSAHMIASIGDERNALLMLTVEADLGAGKATLPAARLYLLDENGKIKTEQVIFYAAPD
jgi:hypothetical protein